MSHALSVGKTLSLPRHVSVCVYFFSLSMSKDAASRSGGSNRGHPRLTVETISGGRDKSRCERQKLRLSLQSPSINLAGGRRRNQFWRGHGSPSVLNEVSHEFSTAMRFEKCKRSPKEFIPTGFPLYDQLPTGTEDSASPLTTPDMVRSGRVLHTSVKSPYVLVAATCLNCYTKRGRHSKSPLLRNLNASLE